MCPPPCGPRRSPRRSVRINNDSYKYAAEFTIGWLNVFAEANTLSGLIDKLWENQDLSCLSRQAQMMGDENDSIVAEKLDRFLEKYYCRSLRSADVKKLDLDFSIGAIKCTAFAYGATAVAELKKRLGK